MSNKPEPSSAPNQQLRQRRSWVARAFLLSLIMGVLAAVCVAGLGAYLAWWPVAQPELKTATGILLDDATRAKLIEMAVQAARDDDVQTIDEYLKSGFSPNVVSQRGDTLLTIAAYHNSVAVVTRLLQQPDVDLEIRNKMGLTAIAAASFKGFTEPLQLLLKHGANVNAANGSNQTALMFASLTGKTECVKMLLAAGAKQDVVDASGNTARSVAETQDAHDVVRALEHPQPSAH